MSYRYDMYWFGHSNIMFSGERDLQGFIPGRSTVWICDGPGDTPWRRLTGVGLRIFNARCWWRYMTRFWRMRATITYGDGVGPSEITCSRWSWLTWRWETCTVWKSLPMAGRRDN